MTAWQLTDWRSILLSSALLLIAMTLVVPRISLQRTVYSVIAFVDVTGSMKVRDMGAGTQSDGGVERLEAAKASLRNLLSELPCQSKLGLGIFTERRSFVLFDPVEVCENFAPIEQSLANLDWRMGWEGDSFVAKGLHHALGEALHVDADILFLTDGQEAPPLPPGSSLPAFEGEPGKVKGAIVGVGGTNKVPIPKFDSEGHESGSYGESDVVQENRTGPPPPDAESRPGYHPKWAPFGSEAPSGDEHLSSVRTEHLQALAGQTGLVYAGLQDEPDLLTTVVRGARPHTTAVEADIRPVPAALALLILVSLYAAPLLAQGFAAIIPNRTGRTA